MVASGSFLDWNILKPALLGDDQYAFDLLEIVEPTLNFRNTFCLRHFGAANVKDDVW